MSKPHPKYGYSVSIRNGKLVLSPEIQTTSSATSIKLLKKLLLKSLETK